MRYFQYFLILMLFPIMGCTHTRTSQEILPCDGVKNYSVSFSVSCPQYYWGESIVFKKEAPFSDPSNRNSRWNKFTLSIEDIENVESILINQYHKAHKERGFKTKIKRVQQHFSTWNRQYMGYIRADNHRIVRVQLLNFSPKVEYLIWLTLIFHTYRDGWISCTGEFCEYNIQSYEIDLTSQKLVIR